jgi:hypothetical protein
LEVEAVIVKKRPTAGMKSFARSVADSGDRGCESVFAGRIWTHAGQPGEAEALLFAGGDGIIPLG